MTARLAHIRRHPIKSIGGEGLDAIELHAARRLPGDREYAVLTEGGEAHATESQTDGAPDRWLPKNCFLRGAAAGTLQAIKGGWQGDKLALAHPDLPDLAFDPDTDSAALVEWLAPLWPDTRAAPTRLVRGAGVWTDVHYPWVSILSLDSLADLDRREGHSFGIDRWRGNLWVSGWAPFAERKLIGEVIRLGDVQLRVTEQIGRCTATCTDTTTGTVDTDMLDVLNRHYGHTEFGVFAEVVTGGRIAVGDEVTA